MKGYLPKFDMYLYVLGSSIMHYFPLHRTFSGPYEEPLDYQQKMVSL